jgi:hypothetical protein
MSTLDHADRHAGLAVEQVGGLVLLGQRLDLGPQVEQAAHVALDLVGGDVLGRRADDDAVLGRLDPVEDRPQALALVVGQALGDAIGRRVGDQHHEPPRQRHLLRQAGALGADRVLRDLAEDGLARPQHVLDAGPAGRRRALDVLGVVLDVAPVEHRVLGRADVDERRLHARQHVLDTAEVDVAVDLGDVVGRVGHVVLDQRPALEHRDLGHPLGDVDAHRVAADRPALALAAAAALQRLVVEAGRLAGDDRLDRLGGLTAAAPAATAVLTLVLAPAGRPAAAAPAAPALAAVSVALVLAGGVAAALAGLDLAQDVGRDRVADLGLGRLGDDRRGPGLRRRAALAGRVGEVRVLVAIRGGRGRARAAPAPTPPGGPGRAVALALALAGAGARGGGTACGGSVAGGAGPGALAPAGLAGLVAVAVLVAGLAGRPLGARLAALAATARSAAAALAGRGALAALVRAG